MHTITAATDIRTKGGRLLAPAGTMGSIALGRTPNRPHHYGRVPVQFVGHARSFWIDPANLHSDGDLEAYIVCRATKPRRLDMPKASTSFHYGRNLRRLRRSAGLTQAALANAMTTTGQPVSQTAISGWESQENPPSGGFVRAAADALGVPVFVFFLELDCDDVIDCLDYIRELQEVVCES